MDRSAVVVVVVLIDGWLAWQGSGGLMSVNQTSIQTIIRSNFPSEFNAFVYECAFCSVRRALAYERHTTAYAHTTHIPSST